MITQTDASAAIGAGTPPAVSSAAYDTTAGAAPGAGTPPAGASEANSELGLSIGEQLLAQVNKELAGEPTDAPGTNGNGQPAQDPVEPKQVEPIEPPKTPNADAASSSLKESDFTSAEAYQRHLAHLAGIDKLKTSAQKAAELETALGSYKEYDEMLATPEGRKALVETITAMGLEPTVPTADPAAIPVDIEARIAAEVEKRLADNPALKAVTDQQLETQAIKAIEGMLPALNTSLSAQYPGLSSLSASEVYEAVTRFEHLLPVGDSVTVEQMLGGVQRCVEAHKFSAIQALAKQGAAPVANLPTEPGRSAAGLPQLGPNASFEDHVNHLLTQVNDL
jgi:hypothetical protein